MSVPAYINLRLPFPSLDTNLKLPPPHFNNNIEMTSRPESETTGLGPEAAARNVTGTATTGPAERFERGIETGTGVGRPVLASENVSFFLQ